MFVLDIDYVSPEQLAETIKVIQEALVNWNAVVAHGTYFELPISKHTVHPSKGLCSSFFSNYTDEFVDAMWREIKLSKGSTIFPVGGRNEFYDWGYPNKRWANPKRKELAERCIPYLQAKLECALLEQQLNSERWDKVAEHLDIVDLPDGPCSLTLLHEPRGDG